MRLPILIAAVCSACIAAAAACAGAPAPSPEAADARCYDLAYERADAAILLPERIEVWLAAADSGRAVWLTGERRTLMVEMEGRVWARSRFHLHPLRHSPQPLGAGAARPGRHAARPRGRAGRPRAA